jgi:phosphonate transport system permease protein
MGASPARAYYRAVVPQIAPSYLTNALYLLETNVRHSSILGYVGAGGIGLLLNEKISWLEYDRVGAILLLLILASLGIETLSRYLTQVVQGERDVSRRTKRGLWLLGAAAAVLCTAGLDGPDFAHTSLRAIRSMVLGLLQPDWSFFFQTGESGLGFLLLETVCIALVGTCAGAVLALPLAFLNTPRLTPKPIAALFRVLVTAIRSVPFLIYGLIFIRVTGPGAFTGVLTLGMCSVGLLCKRFTEAVETLDFRACRALADMGVPLLPRVRCALVPQLRAALVSAVLYRFDVNLREAAVLGLVGAGGIGAPLIFAMNKYAWNTAGAIALGLVLLVWIVDLVSSRLRRKIG